MQNLLYIILVTSFFANRVLAADKCSFRGINFRELPSEFITQLKPSDWISDENTPLNQVYDACEKNWAASLQKAKAKGQSIDPATNCRLRGTAKSPFVFMKMRWLAGKFREIELLFPEHEKAESASAVLNELSSKIGKPVATGSYYEEALHHELRAWKLNRCKIIFDSGALEKVKPSALSIFIFPEDFVPSEGDIRGDVLNNLEKSPKSKK